MHDRLLVQPDNPDAVVFSCDNNHLPYAMFAAERILEVERDRKFDIVICMPDTRLATESYNGRGPIKFQQIDISPLEHFHIDKRMGLGTYYRLLLPGIFKDSYRQLLYLDTDIYQWRTGIQSLFDDFDPDIAVAGAPDITHLIISGERGKFFHQIKAYREALGIWGETYINAGVLLFGVERFNTLGGVERVLNFANAHIDALHRHDQSAINGSFKGDIRLLSPEWNWQQHPLLHGFVERFQPVLVHFSGSDKPWDENDDPFASRFIDDYRSFLARRFPQKQIGLSIRSAKWKAQNPKYKSPLRRGLSAFGARMRAFVRQFHDEASDLRFVEGQIAHWQSVSDKKAPD